MKHRNITKNIIHLICRYSVFLRDSMCNDFICPFFPLLRYYFLCRVKLQIVHDNQELLFLRDLVAWTVLPWAFISGLRQLG